MMLPDVNVLIYAFRTDALEHAASRAWLDSAILNDGRFGISPLALAAVVRIATQARAYKNPSTVAEAFGYCEDILGQPNCHVVEPRERHWEIFKGLCVQTNTHGRRVTDAWFAALAIEWDCEWITFDHDYARFPGLKWRTPGNG